MIALALASVLATSEPSARDCLALVIYTEARGEPILGQLLVAKVVINRSVDSSTGICDIATQPQQFHGVRDIVVPFRASKREWDISRAIADFAIDYLWNVHTYCGRPTYFSAGPASSSALCTVGGHNFS